MTEQDFSPIDISGLLEAAPVGDKPSDKAAGVGDQALVNVPIDVVAAVGDRAMQPSLAVESSSPKGDSGEVASSESEPANRTGEAERSEAESSTIPLYCAKAYTPMYELKREQPHHRLMCILFAQGYTNAEIAEQTGFDRMTVSNVKRQDWAQKLIAELQQTQGERAIKSILCGAAAEVARKMCDTALGKTEAAPAVQLNAQKEVLNRLFGVAPQHIKHEQVNPEDLSTEELRKLIKQN